MDWTAKVRRILAERGWSVTQLETRAAVVPGTPGEALNNKANLRLDRCDQGVHGDAQLPSQRHRLVDADWPGRPPTAWGIPVRVAAGGPEEARDLSDSAQKRLERFRKKTGLEHF